MKIWKKILDLEAVIKELEEEMDDDENDKMDEMKRMKKKKMIWKNNLHLQKLVKDNG